MAVTEAEKQQYAEFLKKIVAELKSLDVKGEEEIWHYTTGASVISIIESGTLYATQVSCLNDSTEIRYASNLLMSALLDLRGSASLSAEEAKFMDEVIKFSSQEPAVSIHIPSRWFVTCFSRQKDDLSQWRAYSGGENGYALSFPAGEFFGNNGLVVHVNYDQELHKKLARTIAEATIHFFREGLNHRGGAWEPWAKEFLPEWDLALSYLPPMVKDPAFAAEDEYRIVHELVVGDLGSLKFRQKQSLMSRHLPLAFSRPNTSAQSQLLPIGEVMVGPSRYQEVSRTSVDTLLKQKGYTNVPVSLSGVPFQAT